MLINRKTGGRPHLSARTVKMGWDKAYRGIISQGPEKGGTCEAGRADLGTSLKIGAIGRKKIMNGARASKACSPRVNLTAQGLPNPGGLKHVQAGKKKIPPPGGQSGLIFWGKSFKKGLPSALILGPSRGTQAPHLTQGKQRLELPTRPSLKAIASKDCCPPPPDRGGTI